jgi:predicted amidohydrolase
VLDYLGQAMADLGAQEQVVTVALDHPALQAFREKFPAWMDADAYELK